jgi:hypothetical protein
MAARLPYARTINNESAWSKLQFHLPNQRAACLFYPGLARWKKIEFLVESRSLAISHYVFDLKTPCARSFINF